MPWVIELGGLGLYTGLRKNVFRVYRRGPYWLVTLLVTFVAFKINELLVNWVPGKGVLGEIISVLVRLGLAYTISILLWCFVLAFVCSCLAEDRAPAPLPHPLKDEA